MPENKRLETLQEEIKLLKGELKNSLSSVRDYLLSMELPSSEFSTMLAALNPDNPAPTMNMSASLDDKKEAAPVAAAEPETEESVEETTDQIDVPPDENLLDIEEPGETMTQELPDIADETTLDEEEPLGGDDMMLSDEEIPEVQEPEEPEELSEEMPEEMPEEIPEEEEMPPESELPAEEEQPMDNDQTVAEIRPYVNEVSQSIPKVNMLANLISWVSKAKKEIGSEQLPTFLEVYGISGYLSPELREVILHLAEITDEKPDAITDAEIWSESILTLHGILTGGDAPLHPVIPPSEELEDEPLPEDEVIEVDKSNDKPVKLKLVFPSADGKEKEFCIDLTPEENNNISSNGKNGKNGKK
jgi:hypothetical protein